MPSSRGSSPLSSASPSPNLDPVSAAGPSRSRSLSPISARSGSMDKEDRERRSPTSSTAPILTESELTEEESDNDGMDINENNMEDDEAPAEVTSLVNHREEIEDDDEDDQQPVHSPKHFKRVRSRSQSRSFSGSPSLTPPPPPSTTLRPKTLPRTGSIMGQHDERPVVGIDPLDAPSADTTAGVSTKDAQEEPNGTVSGDQEMSNGAVDPDVLSEEDGDVTMRPGDRSIVVDPDEDAAEVEGGQQVLEAEQDGAVEPVEEQQIAEQVNGANAQIDVEPAYPTTSLAPPTRSNHPSHAPPPTSAIMRSLLMLEIKFAALRDKLYVERMEEAAAEEEMIIKGTHPALTYLHQTLSSRRERLHEVASRRHHETLAELKRVREAERNHVWSWWTDQRDKMHWEEFEQTWSKRRRLAREKNEIETPRMVKPVPKASERRGYRGVDWSSGAAPNKLNHDEAAADLAMMEPRRAAQPSRHASPAIYVPPQQHPSGMSQNHIPQSYSSPSYPITLNRPNYASVVSNGVPSTSQSVAGPSRTVQNTPQNQPPPATSTQHTSIPQARREGRTVPTTSDMFESRKPVASTSSSGSTSSIGGHGAHSMSSMWPQSRPYGGYSSSPTNLSDAPQAQAQQSQPGSQGQSGAGGPNGTTSLGKSERFGPPLSHSMLNGTGAGAGVGNGNGNGNSHGGGKDHAPPKADESTASRPVTQPQTTQSPLQQSITNQPGPHLVQPSQPSQPTTTSRFPGLSEYLNTKPSISPPVATSSPVPPPPNGNSANGTGGTGLYGQKTAGNSVLSPPTTGVLGLGPRQSPFASPNPSATPAGTTSRP